MKSIDWTEQNKLFGLDYPIYRGKFHDYAFYISYDYDGDPNVEPQDCGCCLVITKNNVKVDSKLGVGISDLVGYCKDYTQKEKEKFLK
jgi:hypothetical protein